MNDTYSRKRNRLPNNDRRSISKRCRHGEKEFILDCAIMTVIFVPPETATARSGPTSGHIGEQVHGRLKIMILVRKIVGFEPS